MRKKLVKIAVGLSGGVDSSVAALLLKQAGYNVIAVFLTCWSKGIGCSTTQDRKDAIAVAAQIGIPIKVWNFEKEYQKRVIDRFFEEYQKGRTPNPDIWCNEEIKFGLFLEKALQELKVDYIATGHYARIKREQVQPAIKGGGTSDSRWHLLSGLDSTKDQSYFLYRLNQFQLSKTLFPIGHLTKQQVREIAKQNNLLTAKKPDSQGICFVGKVDLREFLQKRIKFHQGDVVSSSGEVIGEHEGVEFYTIGQRHGFTIEKYQGAPLYVIEKDVKNNRLVVGRDEESEVGEFEVEEVHFINSKFKIQNSKLLLVRIRHLGEFIPCQIKSHDSNLIIYLIKPTRGVASGQHAVFYQETGLRPELRPRGSKPSPRDFGELSRAAQAEGRQEAGVNNFEVLGGGVIKEIKN